MKIFKYRKFLSDVMINLVSSILITATIQIIIFPFLSRDIGVENFGILIALYGFNNVLVNFLGNSLNNIRLLYDDKITEKGNFSYILNIIIVLNIVISLSLIKIYGYKFSVIEILLYLSFTIASMIRIYSSVFFRIKLEYKKLVFVNIILISGYAIGIYIYSIIKIWSVIFLCGELLALVYIFINTPILKEIPKKDRSFRSLAIEYFNLSSSNGISSSLTYLDRFLINPLLGPAKLAMFYSVSSISKMISMIIIPMTNVLLSYVNKFNKDYVKKYIILTSIVTIIVLIPAYFIIIHVSPFLINILYPDLTAVVNEYIPIVSLTTSFTLLYSTINPYILKFYGFKFQVIIQLAYALIYLILAIFLTLNYGLIGFCVASLISSIVKWILTLFIGIFIKPKLLF